LSKTFLIIERKEFMQKNTTYAADSNPNTKKPRHGNNMNITGYKNTEDSQ